ncbi:MAG TPA: hypothetical protein VMO52_10240 [Acidimicrobiia bacterium]|nr:hypothetical protein [Acidimicrobiia bacterium]
MNPVGTRKAMKMRTPRSGGSSRICAQLPSGVDRLLREIDAGDIGSQPRPGDRIGADMALQMEQIFPGDLA